MTWQNRSHPNRIEKTTRVPQELAVYQRYFSALDAITSQILQHADQSTLTEVMRILSEVSESPVCALFLNALQNTQQVTHCKLHVAWSSSIMSGDTHLFPEWAVLAYQAIPLLHETLASGIVFSQNILDLPRAEKTLFGGFNWINSLHCIPLFVKGRWVGFVAIFSPRFKLEWLSMEINILCTITNDIALCLMRRQAEEEAQANQRRLRSLVGATDDILFEFDQEECIQNVWSSHPSVPRIELRGRKIIQALPASMANAFLQALKSPLGIGENRTCQFSVDLMGKEYYFHARLQSVPAQNGQTQHTIALVRDVTSDVQEESQRRSTLETLNLLEEAVVGLTISGALQHTSNAWANLRGIHPDHIALDIGEPFQRWVHHEDIEKLEAAFDKLAKGSVASHSVRFRFRHEQDAIVWIEAKLIAYHAPNGEITGMRGVLRDITTAHLHESRITQLALFDGLTKLPNRISLDDRLQQALLRADRNQLKVALGFIDMDHFKLINDTFGHKAGDEVLVSLSRRLKAALREIDTLARWGGDEFVVLLPDLSTLGPMRTIAERLREIAREGITLDGLETKPTISIGFAIYPNDANNAEELLSAADHTMFHAKSAGRNNVQFYGDLLHSKSLDRERVALQAKLNKVIHDNGLQIYFQPITNPNTNKVTSLEALVRWHDSALGWISPEIFVPMAEKAGIIRELSDQVLEKVLETLQHWRTLGFKQRVALNVSRTQLFAHDFVSTLLERLQAHELDPSDLILEITESVALTDYSRQSKHLRELSEHGFRIAIDDFGTGYSSLSQLHEMPVDILKVDVSFTSRLHTAEGQRVVQAIVQMAQALQLSVVVEGVENQAALDFLIALGVERIQGYFYSRPISAEDCLPLLQNGIPSII